MHAHRARVKCSARDGVGWSTRGLLPTGQTGRGIYRTSPQLLPHLRILTSDSNVATHVRVWVSLGMRRNSVGRSSGADRSNKVR
jgi:hypothetical protein